MSRKSLFFLIAALVALPGCPQPTGTPVDAPTEVTPSLGATTAPSEAPATAAPARERVLVSGKVYDDEGDLVEAGRVRVESTDDPALNQEVAVVSGTYVVPNVTIGAALRLIASADGLTARTRLHRAAAIPVDSGRDVNRVDFGGADAEVYALSEFPEIAAVTPAHKATGVTSSPLEVTFTFSHPFSGDERKAFSRLLRLRFSTGSSGDAELLVGSEYEGRLATLDWNEAGTQATFRFNAPLVTRQGRNAVVRIEFDEARNAEAWPKASNGKRLGGGRTPSTISASGGMVSDAVAPFLREVLDTKLPDDPDPLEIWGRAHQTSTNFSLAAQGDAPRVTGVAAYKGNNGDRIEVTFDRPMRGFPESAVDQTVLRPSNFRFVLGETSDAESRERFAAQNPAVDGGSASEAVTFSSRSENVLVIRLPAGTLGSFDVFKLYVDPSVADITGTPIRTSPQDPTTFLADHVLEGTIQ